MLSTKHNSMNVEDTSSIMKSKRSAVDIDKVTLRSEIHCLMFQLILYTIQGLPMGLSASIPLVLVTNKMVTMSSLGMFSTVALPFSLKILWAPIIDCLHIERFGRRKCWLMPIQLICGILMVFMGLPSWWDFDDDDRPIIDQWIDPITPFEAPDIPKLTALFIVYYFLMATQDIVVDGWAVSMLSPSNRGLASTMNTIGQSLGIVIGNSVFLALRDEEIMYRIFGTTQALTLGSFTGYCGIAIIIVSLLLPLKREPSSTNDDDDYGIFGSTTSTKIINAYKCVYQVAKLRPVMRLAVILVLTKFPFASVDRLTTLELVKNGLSKESMALISPVTMIMGFVVPIVISGYTHGRTTNEKFVLWAKAYNLRLLTIPLAMLLVFIIRYMKGSQIMDSPDSGEGSIAIQLTLYLIYSLIAELIQSFMFLMQMCIFNEVCDPQIGGIYMTFLNTLANIGALSTGFVVYPMLDLMPYKDRFQPYMTLGVFSVAVGIFGGIFVQNSMRKMSHYQPHEWRVGIEFGASPKHGKEE